MDASYKFDKANDETTITALGNNLSEYSFTTAENIPEATCIDYNYHNENEVDGYTYVKPGVLYNTKIQEIADCMEDGDIAGFLACKLIIESVSAYDKTDFKKYLSTTITNAINRILSDEDDDPKLTMSLIQECVNKYGIELTETQKKDLEYCDKVYQRYLTAIDILNAANDTLNQASDALNTANDALNTADTALDEIERTMKLEKETYVELDMAKETLAMIRRERDVTADELEGLTDEVITKKRELREIQKELTALKKELNTEAEK